MAEFVKVADTDEIKEGSMKGFTVKGNKLLIANVKGKYFSICSKCTHKGGPLADGKIEENIITCPWHNGKFDVTNGKIVSGPPKENEKKYEIKVQGRDILVKI